MKLNAIVVLASILFAGFMQTQATANSTLDTPAAPKPPVAVTPPVPKLVTQFGVLEVPDDACYKADDLYIYLGPEGTMGVSSVSCVYAVKNWLEAPVKKYPRA